MLIPIFKFKYTMTGYVDFQERRMWVRFQSNNRVIDPDKQYHCKSLNGDPFHPIQGSLILNPVIEHIELESKEDKEIPEDWTIEQIFKYLGVPITAI